MAFLFRMYYLICSLRFLISIQYKSLESVNIICEFFVSKINEIFKILLVCSSFLVSMNICFLYFFRFFFLGWVDLCESQKYELHCYTINHTNLSCKLLYEKAYKKFIFS